MSTFALVRAWDEPLQSSVERLVLLYIADVVGIDGWCNAPDQHDLARFACASEEEVDQALVSLEARGLVRLTPFKAAGLPRRCYSYNELEARP